jgi:hypothetical protein
MGAGKLSTEPVWLEVKLWAKGAGAPFGTVPAVAVPAIDDFVTVAIARDTLSTVNVNLATVVGQPPAGDVEIVRIDLIATSPSGRILLGGPRLTA